MEYGWKGDIGKVKNWMAYDRGNILYKRLHNGKYKYNQMINHVRKSN
jgi:hypothetical protein